MSDHAHTCPSSHEETSTSEPCALGKRRERVQSVDDTNFPAPQAKRVRTGLTRILRPGLPQETPWNSYRVAGKPSPPLRKDDQDGHYVFELGENLSSRYKILSKLGEGTFGRVLECWDRKHREYVAIKVVRNVEKYRHAAMIELEVLNTIEHNDPSGKWHCMTLREWFDFRGHVCMVFDKLGPSLFDLTRHNTYRPFSAKIIQEFAHQLLEAVAFLHELRLVHTDLKPENILMVDVQQPPKRPSGRMHEAQEASPPLTSTAIKVIDFGSATFEDQYHSSIVSTRHYRAPEVILGVGWSSSCDLWSVGCILVELATGDALFQTHDNIEHLAMMERALGPVPPTLVARASKAANKFFLAGELCWPELGTTTKSKKNVAKMQNLRSLLAERCDVSLQPHVDLLVDLVLPMLAYEPALRRSAAEALEHPFFNLQLPSSTAHDRQAGDGGEHVRSSGGRASGRGARMSGGAPVSGNGHASGSGAGASRDHTSGGGRASGGGDPERPGGGAHQVLVPQPVCPGYPMAQHPQVQPLPHLHYRGHPPHHREECPDLGPPYKMGACGTGTGLGHGQVAL